MEALGGMLQLQGGSGAPHHYQGRARNDAQDRGVHLIDIEGVQVEFPFEPYPCQVKQQEEQGDGSTQRRQQQQQW